MPKRSEGISGEGLRAIWKQPLTRLGPLATLSPQERGEGKKTESQLNTPFFLNQAVISAQPSSAASLR
jgi:hypothetical protein